MEAVYVERDCTFTHEGRTVESGGAVVTPEYVTGYVQWLGTGTIGAPHQQWGTITDWHGNVLGRVTRYTSWRTHSSHYTKYMYQITAIVRGVRYTGRSGGEGMIWNGKRCARQ